MTPRVKAGKWSTINGDKQEKLAIRISSKTDIKLHREGLQDIKKAFCGLCHNNCTRNVRPRANWQFFLIQLINCQGELPGRSDRRRTRQGKLVCDISGS